MPRTREVNRFNARSDDGTYQVQIVETQEMIDASSSEDPHAVLRGLVTARTTQGHLCIWRAEGVYAVNDPDRMGVVVKRVGL